MKIIRFLLAIILLFIAASPGLVQASAAGAEANDADAALNKVYGKLQASITDATQKKLLVAAEAAWIKDRDANVALFAGRYPFSKGGLFYKTYLTVERTKFLQALLDNAGGDEAEGPTEYQQ
ncbi:MAG: lysozyme inhibitor LprI family protein [Chthoniobacterales bacterium]